VPTGQRDKIDQPVNERIFFFLQHIGQARGIILVIVIGKILNWKVQETPPKNFHGYPSTKFLWSEGIGNRSTSSDRATGQRARIFSSQRIEVALGINLVIAIGKDLNWRGQKRPPKNFHGYLLKKRFGPIANRSTR